MTQRTRLLRLHDSAHVFALVQPGEAISGDLTLGRWMRDRALATPSRSAIEYCGETTSYAELDARSERLAGALLGLGLRRGDRVASLTRNRPEHVELFFACAKAALVLAPLSRRLTPAELAYQLGDAEPVALFVEPERTALLVGEFLS